MDILRRIFSIMWCFLRLAVVLMITLFSSINKILFDNMEIVSVSLVMRPQAPERSTLGFIDKLCLNNRELVKGGIIPEANEYDKNDPFIPDDLLIEEEQIGPGDEEDEQTNEEEQEHGNDDDDENGGKGKC